MEEKLRNIVTSEINKLNVDMQIIIDISYILETAIYYDEVDIEQCLSGIKVIKKLLEGLKIDLEHTLNEIEDL